MRPGRNAPENPFAAAIILGALACFNEAGAKCPGEPRRRARQRPDAGRFNEAGAKCPGEPHEPGLPLCRGRASMRPGRNAPENTVDMTFTYKGEWGLQ